MNIKETDKQYIMGTYGRVDLAIDHGEGSTLYDTEGKKYIDFGSGIAVNTFGASDPEWVKAVGAQLGKIQHTSNYYYTRPCAELAEMLCQRTNMSKVFFSNSGAEANECAIKAARKYGTDKNPSKNVIITLKNSFHGRTITTLSATGQDVFHTNFTPFTEGFVYVEANNVDELTNAMNDNICGIMIELIQGEGGVLTMTQEFVTACTELAKKYDALLIIDEVQTGNGRTGTLYAHQQFGVAPDIFTTAKGLGGGLPIGATIFAEKVQDILPAGSHGSTFGGNPIAAAGAVNILSRIDDKLLAEVSQKSELIKSELSKLDLVEEISGMGLMLGIKTKKSAKDIMLYAMKKGLLVLTAKDKVRLLPPLNIANAELERGLEILKDAIKNA